MGERRRQAVRNPSADRWVLPDQGKSCGETLKEARGSPLPMMAVETSWERKFK